MPYITIDAENDHETELYFEDHGTGQPVLFIHGWPLSHRMWEAQVGPFIAAGYRVITYDRRGFGDSSRMWEGYDYDAFAADLDALITELDLQNINLVGFSMGGGEVARYIATYGSDRIARVALVAAVTPFLLKTADNPDGIDESVFADMRQKVSADRFAFFDDFDKQFFNYSDGASDNLVSPQLLAFNNVIAGMASPKAMLDCITAFSGSDFRDDLAAVDKPTLIVHGDSDAVVPFAVSGQRVPQFVKGAQTHVIEGGPHGLPSSHAAELNQVLLDFIGG